VGDWFPLDLARASGVQQNTHLEEQHGQSVEITHGSKAKRIPRARPDRWLFAGSHKDVLGSAIKITGSNFLPASATRGSVIDPSAFDTTAGYPFEPAPEGTLFGRFERGCARVDAKSISQS
jgi:hypothetical protein